MVMGHWSLCCVLRQDTESQCLSPLRCIKASWEIKYYDRGSPAMDLHPTWGRRNIQKHGTVPLCSINWRYCKCHPDGPLGLDVNKVF